MTTVNDQLLATTHLKNQQFQVLRRSRGDNNPTFSVILASKDHSAELIDGETMFDGLELPEVTENVGMNYESLTYQVFNDIKTPREFDEAIQLIREERVAMIELGFSEDVVETYWTPQNRDYPTDTLVQALEGLSNESICYLLFETNTPTRCFSLVLFKDFPMSYFLRGKDITRYFRLAREAMESIGITSYFKTSHNLEAQSSWIRAFNHLPLIEWAEHDILPLYEQCRVYECNYKNTEQWTDEKSEMFEAINFEEAWLIRGLLLGKPLAILLAEILSFKTVS